MWYLKQFEEMVETEKLVSGYTIGTIPRNVLMEAKMKGFADRQIAHLLGCKESQVHDRRMALNIHRVWKLVDTCAAEFAAQTPYYYSTFENDMEIDGKHTIGQREHTYRP